MNKIPVCRPTLPDFNQYCDGLSKIWKTRMLSNFGEYALKLEEILMSYLGTNKIKIVGNADIGLTIALSALEVEAGSEVILPSFTFNSTANCVIWNGLKPVFADIDNEDFCLDPTDVEKKISPKTRVILATHVFGNPCQIEKLRDIADRHKLYLIFDAAQAYGSKYKDVKVGTFGDIEVFSFSGTKVVTSAEGGVVVAKTQELVDKVGMGRNFGFTNDYNSKRIGSNGKISEFNALLGCLNFPKIEDELKTRFKLVNKYINELLGTGDIKFQLIRQGNRSVYKDMAILTSKRDELATYLEEHGIQTKKYFYPIHTMDYYKDGISLPVTEKIAQTCLCIPLYDEMTEEEQDLVISNIKSFYNK
jgi:dTDP-4-amino-4,6-dideoxygalactose transaminase